MSATSPKEVNNRFLVQDIDRSIVKSFPTVEILQTRLETKRRGGDPDATFHGRFITSADGTERGFLTINRGSGRVRDEFEIEFEGALVRSMMAHTKPVLRKTRYYSKDGWEIDFFHDELEGIILAEREMTEEFEKAILPSWISRAEDMTESLTDLHLTRLAEEMRFARSVETRAGIVGITELEQPALDDIKHLPRIVLTGSPCSGKTTVLSQLAHEIRASVHLVPDLATTLITQLGFKSDPEDTVEFMRFKNRLARVQLTFEELAEAQARRDGKQAILLDQSLADVATHLECDAQKYRATTGGDIKTSGARYSLVIVLDTLSKDMCEKYCRNNPARCELHEECSTLTERIRTAWDLADTSKTALREIHSENSTESKLRAVDLILCQFLDID